MNKFYSSQLAVFFRTKKMEMSFPLSPDAVTAIFVATTATATPWPDQPESEPEWRYTAGYDSIGSGQTIGKDKKTGRHYIRQT